MDGWRTFRLECGCEAREREEAEARAAEQRQRAARDQQQRAVAAHLWVPRPSDPRLAMLEKALLGQPATVGLRAAQTYARRAPRGSDRGAHFVCSCRRRAELYARALLAGHQDAGAIVGALRLTLWLDDAATPEAAESFIPRRQAAATVEVLALLDFGDHPGKVAALHALGNLLQRRLDARLTTHAAGTRTAEQWLR